MRTLSRTLTAVALSLLLLPAHAQALQDALSALQRKDYPTALRLLEPLAKAGNAQAQTRLGLLYYNGQGVRESNADAVIWFERAARQGLAEAQYQLANMYTFGMASVPADTDPSRIAAQWYFEAANQGHAEAQYSLGILFLTGSGVTQSNEEANKWIARAAQQGHADAKAYQAGSGAAPPPKQP